MDNLPKPEPGKIAFLGNYLPRQCGIATFTSDLCESVASEYPHSEVFSLAMNDIPEGYAYPARVRFEIPQDDLKMYRCAADFLNMSEVDLLCVQHEFGIFGGVAGSHILALLRGVNMPVVTTLHTILTNPNPDQRQLMTEMLERSDRVIVMSQRGQNYLQDIYGVSQDKIDLIPHGIPDVPFGDSNFYKDKFNVEGKLVMLTFGLLSPNKGIENVIQALPAILERYPEVVYIILGATHPHVIRYDGEAYRNSLESLARKLGVEEHVIFYNQFVSLDELKEFISAADVYITPYLNPAQIVSGTLAYTVGAGKAVISTPYWYADELLADGRGLIVPFQDANAIAENVLYLFSNESERHAIRKRAYLYGREMIWPKIAERYMSSFTEAIERRASNHQIATYSSLASGLRIGNPISGLPPMNLSHLVHMTDSTGILQHAIFHLPNYNEGYATDDNARALVLAIMLDRLGIEEDADIAGLASRYLAFIWHAFNAGEGRFRNQFGYNRSWAEEIGSEDCHGRALWSLGAVLHQSGDENLRGVAARLFNQSIATTLSFSSPRAWAFALLGIHEYLCRFQAVRSVMKIGEALAERLLERYQETQGPGWHWFEAEMTYDNATLPHALFLISHWLKRPDMARIALEALEWLVDIQTSPKGYFAPIGNLGFFRRGGEPARFDQQPIEAAATISACLDVYRSTRDVTWYGEAKRAFNWFLGENDLSLPVYDPNTGGCYDGLHPDRVNKNQGAESTLSFLMSLAEMYLLEHYPVTKESSTLLYSSSPASVPADDPREVHSW